MAGIQHGCAGERAGPRGEKPASHLNAVVDANAADVRRTTTARGSLSASSSPVVITSLHPRPVRDAAGWCDARLRCGEVATGSDALGCDRCGDAVTVGSSEGFNVRGFVVRRDRRHSWLGGPDARVHRWTPTSEHDLM